MFIWPFGLCPGILSLLILAFFFTPIVWTLHELLILSAKLQLLLERGANIEAKDEDGAIPLHDACAGGS